MPLSAQTDAPRPSPEQPLLRIGTRASALAVTQCRWMQQRITEALGYAADQAEAVAPLVFITTTGDRIQDRRLLEAGGKQLFTKEIEEALLDGRVDVAIHSMKDVPAQQPDGLSLCAIPVREDGRDAFLSPVANRLEDLPAGAKLGTASLRRQAQMLALRPDLTVEMLRGNVDTRLRRLKNGDFDAILLAAAGLNRLGLSHEIQSFIDPIQAPPAPGQGALAMQCRSEDANQAWIQSLHHAPTALCVAAERGALEALEGSCRTAMGAYARLGNDGSLSLVTEALTADGTVRWRREGQITNPTPDSARALGLSLGQSIRDEAGERLILCGL